MKNAGVKLRELREELGVKQKEFGKMIQVDGNTESKWERQAKIPGGAHRKKVEFLLELADHENLKEVLKATLESEGGKSATAGLIGMLFGIVTAQDITVKQLWGQLKQDTYLLAGIKVLKESAHKL